MTNKVIKHYGVPRRSGRYPWGSGKDAYQRTPSKSSHIKELEKQGLKETEIAKGLGLNTTELRKQKTISRLEKRSGDVALAVRLKEKGYSNTEIGRRMGINESSVRSLLNPAIKQKTEVIEATSSVLKNAVDNKGLIDIGAGVEQHLGINRSKLNTAVALLEKEGYTVHTIQVEQAGSGKYTNIKVLAPPGTSLNDVNRNRDQIKLVNDYSEDGGITFRSIEKPTSIDSSRILVRYKEDGGANRDGMIEIRPGVADLSLGENKYAQVRIAVDGNKYMKGMAIYNKDIPLGKDVIYNTNKTKNESDKVFKTMEDDPDDPFGSSIRQRHYIDSNGKEKLSAINIVGYKEGSGEEGSWRAWDKNLSSQVLSKQSPALAKKQLDLAYNIQKEQFDEIMSLTNPSVKRELLRQFSDGADAEAVHLKAAALPRQNTHVILSFNSIKENEVYAPNYNDGESVVLIRHPHGGIFEIPEVRVNNRNKEAKSAIGNAKDAIGLNAKTAAILSGADFDGDTVLVIPNKNRYIKTASPLKGLKDFDPKTAYKDLPANEKPLDSRGKGIEMGKISNLITDMTIRGASHDEIARAVRHSMVVIDAEKHKLNYKQSYLDNNISDLKKKYQGSEQSGASTIISKSSAEIRINERTAGKYVTDPKTGKEKKIYIDPVTGKKLYTETGQTYLKRKPIKDPITGKKSYYYLDASGNKVYYDEKGTTRLRKVKTTRMAETDDAFKLSSGSVIEDVYANHANRLKALANTARLEILKTKDIPYSPSARLTYKKEADNLKAQLALAYRNKPLERQAILVANKMIAAKRRANPDMDESDIKKLRNEELTKARAKFQAKREPIVLTPKLWEAIQAGAISPSMLSKILENTNPDSLKNFAMPKYSKGISPAKLARAKTMKAIGYTTSEIASALGVSVNTLADNLD